MQDTMSNLTTSIFQGRAECQYNNGYHELIEGRKEKGLSSPGNRNRRDGRFRGTTAGETDDNDFWNTTKTLYTYPKFLTNVTQLPFSL